MLVNVDVNFVGYRAPVFRPHLLLREFNPVQGLGGLTVTAIGQGLRVRKNPTQLVHPAGLPLDINGGSEVATRIVHPDPHLVAGSISR